MDVNDAPTATGSNEWHSPRGMDHAQWSKIMTQFAMKHPLKDEDLVHKEIYLAKVLDTRPIDSDYKKFYEDGAEVKLRGDGRLREMIIGWTEYESIPVNEILQHMEPNQHVADYEEIVYAANVVDNEYRQDNKVMSVRDMVQTDDDYTECDDRMVNIMQDHVTNVLHRLSGQSVEQLKQQSPEDGPLELITTKTPDVFPNTMEDILAFAQEEDCIEDLVCQVVNTGTQHKTIGAAAEDTIKEQKSIDALSLYWTFLLIVWIVFFLIMYVFNDTVIAWCQALLS